MTKSSVFSQILGTDEFIVSKHLFSRKCLKSVLLSAAVGGAVIGIFYWWFKSRRSADRVVINSETRDIDDPTILAMHSMDFYSQAKLSSNRSVGSVFSRTSTASEKPTFTSSARKLSQPSVANDSDIDDSSSLVLDYKRLGLRALAGVVEHLESLMCKVKVLEDKGLSPSSDSDQLINDLRVLLEHAYRLREQYKQQLVLHDGSYRQGSLESLVTSQEDTSSYFSASEHLDLTELELLMQFNVRRPLYYSALKLLNESDIPYRALRTQFVGCELDIEYLGKVHCLRQAFDYIFDRPESTDWMIKVGKLNVCRLLHCLGYPSTDFDEAYERLMAFVISNRNKSNSMMSEELYAKGVKVINFYDVVFDLMLLEAFELLANPPSSVLSVTRHKWLSDNFKRCALDSTVWTILLAKRKMIKYPDGFYAHYYSMVGTILPALAWGFLGPNENYFRLCDRFRETIISFIRESFICYDSSILTTTATTTATNGLSLAFPDEHFVQHDEFDRSTLVNCPSVDENINSSTPPPSSPSSPPPSPPSVASDVNDNDDSVETVSESGPTLVCKQEDFHQSMTSNAVYHRQIGLRYTTVEELGSDLYKLINIYSKELLNIFMHESQSNGNPLPEKLQSNPLQPDLRLSYVV